MYNQYLRIICFLLLAVPASYPQSHAAEKPPVYLDASGVALRGYDPVAYFTDGKPVKGSKQFSVAWMDATWYFSNEAHREVFKSDPEKYAPRFGGYCAYAVSRNYTWAGDPRVWRIEDGKLYLNANSEAQQLWEEDVPGNIMKGNAYWPGVLKK